MGNGSIGLAVSTQNKPFFVTLMEGAKAAAGKMGVELQVTDAGDDAAKQTTDIETLVASGISVLIVNPVDSDAVAGAVQSAIAAVKAGRMGGTIAQQPALLGATAVENAVNLINGQKNIPVEVTLITKDNARGEK